MNTSILTSKNRISLPAEVVEAARLRLHDEIFWSVDPQGELHGRKLVPGLTRGGRLVTDQRTGLIFWRGGITDQEAEAAALDANISRHD